MHADPTPTRSLSVRQLARRWSVSPATVRQMIRRGIVQAIDVGTTRTQMRITPEAVREAENRLAVRKPPARRRRERLDPEIESLLAD